jgi:hypothetical protein
MTRDTSEVEAALQRKGFKSTHPGSDHNWYVYVSSEGKKAIRARTKTSHGRSIDLDDHLLNQMARQVSLTKKQFVDLVDCPLTREAYEDILKTPGNL